MTKKKWERSLGRVKYAGISQRLRRAYQTGPLNRQDPSWSSTVTLPSPRAERSHREGQGAGFLLACPRNFPWLSFTGMKNRFHLETEFPGRSDTVSSTVPHLPGLRHALGPLSLKTECTESGSHLASHQRYRVDPSGILQLRT